MSKDLRNGAEVENRLHQVGFVHDVSADGFHVRYNHYGESVDYAWSDENLFTVVRAPQLSVHDAVAQELTVRRLNRDKVEELLREYRVGLALDLEEIADDVATPDRQRIGLNAAAERLRKAEDL